NLTKLDRAHACIRQEQLQLAFPLSFAQHLRSFGFVCLRVWRLNSSLRLTIQRQEVCSSQKVQAHLLLCQQGTEEQRTTRNHEARL
ncbi:unnamed protein product, partial [Amoebophrya sp. A120]